MELDIFLVSLALGVQDKNGFFVGFAAEGTYLAQEVFGLGNIGPKPRAPKLFD